MSGIATAYRSVFVPNRDWRRQRMNETGANPAVKSHSCEWPFLGDEQKFADKVTHFRSAPKTAVDGHAGMGRTNCNQGTVVGCPCETSARRPLYYLASCDARRRPVIKSSRCSALRRCLAAGTTIEVMSLSCLTT